jgi:hypothetical protein
MRVTPVFILVMVLLLAQYTATAQRAAPGSDTVLKGATIEVIQTYKPRVKQSPKPEWKPQLPPVDTSRPAFNPTVPQQTLYYTYNSPPLRPLALGKSDNERPYPNYVKAGGGNLSTIYLDAGIGGIYGDNYETGIHLHHLSQKGTIVNQQSSLSGLEAEGTLHNDMGDWHASLTGAHNRYGYYGYNHLLHNYSMEDVSQAYTLVRVAADMTNKKDSNSLLDYHPSISASTYNARYNTSEITIGFNAPVTYTLNDNVGLHVGLAGAFTNYKSGNVSTGNNFISAAPGLKMRFDNYTAHALAGVALGKNGSTYFLPDLELAFSMTDYLFRLSIGWQAQLRQNTYEQLTTENPYMVSNYPVIQTKRDEVFAHVQGSLGKFYSYQARVSWWNYLDLPTFLNDTGDQKAFYLRYQNVNALSFQASLRYHVANKWSTGISGEYYSFYRSTDQHVWHEPATRFKWDVMVTPIPKLDVSANMYLLTGIHALDATSSAVTLDPVVDLGVNAEYRFIPRLSAFLQLSNLLNSKYQRWQGYQVYGFNIYGGLRLKF